MSNRRIEFIDLLKGICIILVVIGHCGVSISLLGLVIVRMPLYFAISGFFYKDYGGIENLLLRKINKIMVPFIFFYITAYLIFYILKLLAPSLLITNARGIFDVFNNRQLFNGPLWFLLSLFWCNIFYALIQKISKNIKNQVASSLFTVVVVVLIAMSGRLLRINEIYLPMFIDSAFTAMPFFYFGILLKKTSIINLNSSNNHNILFGLIFYLFAVILELNFHYRLGLSGNNLEGNVTYLLGICSVIAIIYFCKVIRYLPVVSYLGKYSLIVLCIHHLIYRPLSVFFKIIPCELINNNIFLAVATLICCYIAIPICLKYIPYFVAQKDII